MVFSLPSTSHIFILLLETSNSAIPQIVPTIDCWYPANQTAFVNCLRFSIFCGDWFFSHDPTLILGTDAVKAADVVHVLGVELGYNICGHYRSISTTVTYLDSKAIKFGEKCKIKIITPFKVSFHHLIQTCLKNIPVPLSR